MKILLIHNRYLQYGGEDVVFESEQRLLQKYDKIVETLIFDNKDITSFYSRLKYGLSSFYNLKSASLLEDKINKFKPNIIHVHNFFPIASPSIFYIAYNKKIPIVMTLHNYRLLCPNAMLFRNNTVCEECINKNFALNAVVHSCYRNSTTQSLLLASMLWLHKKLGTWHNKVDRYIALTNFAKQKFIHSSLSLTQNKISIKPNFVEDNSYSNIKENYFLFVGRLSEEKGINVLLDAFEKNNNKLEIIGNGPLQNKVLKASKKNPNIKYHGFQSSDFISKKLKKAKALVFTSIWYEGMPMTILEAFSTGTPVICGDIGGPAEIVHDGINGLVYEAGQSDELRKKINWLSKNPDKALELSQNARITFEQNYSEEKSYKQLMQIYEDVIFEKKKSHQ